MYWLSCIVLLAPLTYGTSSLSLLLPDGFSAVSGDVSGVTSVVLFFCCYTSEIIPVLWQLAASLGVFMNQWLAVCSCSRGKGLL